MNTDIFQIKVKEKKGFTLVELLVAIGIFVIVVLIVTGIIVSLMRLNRSNQQGRLLLTSMNTVMDAITLPARERVTGTVFFCRNNNLDGLNAKYYPTWRYVNDDSFRSITYVTGNPVRFFKKLCVQCSSGLNCPSHVMATFGQSISFLSQTRSETTLRNEELLFYHKPGWINAGTGKYTPGGIYMSRCNPTISSDRRNVTPPSSAVCPIYNQMITPEDIDVKKFFVVPIASTVQSVFTSNINAQQGIQIIIEAETTRKPIKKIHLQTAVAARQL